MKYITLLLIALLIPIVSFSQQPTLDIKKLLEVTSNGVVNNKNISFDEQRDTLIVGDLVIPVLKQTHVKRIKHRGVHSVEFSLQEGTAITSSTNPDFKKAWLLLEFKSRALAKEFIKHFKNVSKG